MVLALQPEAEAQYNISYPTVPTFPSGDPPLGQPLQGSSPATNGRNAYPSDNPDGPPLQFVYEAANCRLFYQFQDLNDITGVWRRVANVAWGNGTCAAGSTVSASNRFPQLANATLPYSSKVNLNAALPPGAGGANTTQSSPTNGTFPANSTRLPTSTTTNSTRLPSMTSKGPSPVFTGGARSLSVNKLALLGITGLFLGMDM